MPPEIETERLTLRAPVYSDAKSFARLISDPDIARMTGTIPYPYFTLCADFWIMSKRANWRQKKTYAYIITTKKGDLIGAVEFFYNGGNEPEIGYWIGRPYWSQGYATEMATAFIAIVFTHLDIPFIHAGYFTDNPGSGRVLEKLGFSFHEKSSHYSVSRGQAHETIELRLANPKLNTQAGIREL